MYWLPFWANMQVTISLPPSENECQLSINHFCGCSVCYTASNCIVSFLNLFIHSQSFQYVLVYNITNIHAMSHRSDFFLAHSSRVNFYTARMSITMTYVLTDSQVELPRYQSSRAMADSKSFHTMLPEVMISFKNEGFFFRDLSNLTLQRPSDDCLASVNISSMCPIASNNSTLVPSWRFSSHS